MGYEVKIYVGELSDYENDGCRWFNTIGMVNLCKPGSDSQIRDLPELKGIPIYFYAEDGNTEVTKDRYSKSLEAIPLSEVIKVLVEDVKLNYRRFNIALDFLNSIENHWKNQEVYAVLYGY